MPATTQAYEATNKGGITITILALNPEDAAQIAVEPGHVRRLGNVKVRPKPPRIDGHQHPSLEALMSAGARGGVNWCFWRLTLSEIIAAKMSGQKPDLHEGWELTSPAKPL
ncbi:hypothetical protein OpiT1DRAFT_05659 [Opitutaceae bacterium TAV1]|nr:hypothetical protein OpiT1DRAFT_05659 [Opitutaceae bacterium TAV1]